MQNDSKSHSQAIHVLKSHLNALKISFSTDSESADLIVNGATGDIPVFLTEGKSAIDGSKCEISVNDIIAPNLERVLESIHLLTEFAGFGRPLPVDRGPAKKGRITYHDQYEDVVLRHQLLRRSPNPDKKELERCMPIIRRVVYGIMRQFKPVFSAMSMDENDLISIAMVHTVSFLHNYAYETETKNDKLLTEFLVQRLGEVAKITFWKAYNCSCLPQSIKKSLAAAPGNPDWSDDDMYSRALGTYESQEVSSADTEYEEGTYVLEVEGKKYQLDIVSDGLLGIKAYVNNKELDEAGLRWLGASINDGAKLSAAGIQEPEEETPSEVAARRHEAREKLYDGLDKLTPENREWTLAYAALSRDFCDEARNAARKICEELICPQCNNRLQASSTCKDCNVDGQPRYGVDYLAVREKLYAANDPAAAVMNAPISEAATRAKKKKARKLAEAETAPKSEDEKKAEAERKRQEVYNELPAVLTCPKPACKKSNPKSTFVRSEDVSSSNLSCPSCNHSDHQYEFWAKQKQVELFASLPATLVCGNPECAKEKPKADFGIRVPRLSLADKRPLSACLQSRCKPCRKPVSYGKN